jgi:thiol-disulfide isomerase/thioredoxin
MRKLLLIPIFFIGCLNIYSQDSTQTKKKQKKINLTEDSIVTDSTGVKYPYSIWKAMIQSGEYVAEPVNPEKKNTSYILKEAKEQKQDWLDIGDKPRESPYFTTGKQFPSFSSTDINNDKINIKGLKGKILVINFWFIDCPPCRKEIPELNALVNNYSADSNIVFIAIAPDPDLAIKNFLQGTSFDYRLVGFARQIIRGYNVEAFPTNIIVDKEGNVAFHTIGYNDKNVFWLKKTIEELKSK